MTEEDERDKISEGRSKAEKPMRSERAKAGEERKMAAAAIARHSTGEQGGARVRCIVLRQVLRKGREMGRERQHRGKSRERAEIVSAAMLSGF